MHVFECEVCKENKPTQDDLNKHIEDQHTFTCPVCNIKLPKKADLEKHQVEMHTCCSVCLGEFETKESLSCHMLEHHTFTSDVCHVVCINEESIEDHILEKHAVPDEDNWYKCDDCSFQSKDKSYFGRHFKEEHGSKAPSKKLEDENRILKNNFERLEAMYHDSLEEVNKTKSEYEARLIVATAP